MPAFIYFALRFIAMPYLVSIIVEMEVFRKDVY
jgi:hypothetical protein